MLMSNISLCYFSEYSGKTIYDYLIKSDSCRQEDYINYIKTKIKNDTLDTKSNLEFLIKTLESDKNQIHTAKRWDSISFWNGTDKKAKKEIFDQIISVLQNIKKNSSCKGIFQNDS